MTRSTAVDHQNYLSMFETNGDDWAAAVQAKGSLGDSPDQRIVDHGRLVLKEVTGVTADDLAVELWSCVTTQMRPMRSD